MRKVLVMVKKWVSFVKCGHPEICGVFTSVYRIHSTLYE
jgi:hypothetical protein